MLLYTIIAQYRTGGQNLMHWIKQSLQNEFIVIHEPFNSNFNITQQIPNYKILVGYKTRNTL